MQREEEAQEGLEKIIHILISNNKSLNKSLLNLYSDTQKFDRPVYKDNGLSLDPDWVSGFTDGDGSFYVTITSNEKRKQIRAFYQIGLKDRDILILEKIKSFFHNIGQIKHDSRNNNYIYQVARISDLVDVIIPHFRKYPLQGDKLRKFLIWADIITLMNSKAHLTQEGWTKVLQLKEQFNLPG